MTPSFADLWSVVNEGVSLRSGRKCRVVAGTVLSDGAPQLYGSWE